MGIVKHIRGNVKEYNEIKKENIMLFLAIIALFVIVLYFFYVFTKVVVLLQATEMQENIQTQILLVLPHLILLSLFGVPIVRKVLLWIKFTPFYLSHHTIKKMRSKTYNRIRLKRFSIYFIISLACFIVSIFYILIL